MVAQSPQPGAHHKNAQTFTSLICKKINMQAEHIVLYEQFRTKTRINTEAKGNSELTYLIAHFEN